MGMNSQHNYDCRLFERVTVNVPGQIFVRGEPDSSPCTLLNLSGSGARITTERRFNSFDAVVLYAEGFGRFECITIPRSGQLTALHFIMGAEQMREYLAVLADFKLDGRLAQSRLRRHPRRRTTGAGHFERTNGRLAQCQIQDVSLQGASLKTEVRPEVGEIISFGMATGRVVRHHIDGIGVFFLCSPQERDHA
jgi:PilZ domain